MPLRDRRRFDLARLRRAGLLLAAVLLASGIACPGARAAISFLPPVAYDKPGVLGLLAADLDGDGKLDLAATGNGSVSFFYGKGDGAFEPRIDLPLGDGLHDVQAADLNGDGLPDLVITRNDTVLVLLNQGGRSYAPPVSYHVGSPPCGVTVADLNGDGVPDLAVSNAGSNNVCVLLNKGDGTFAPALFYPAGQVPGQILAADLRGNGQLDLAVANIVSGSVLLYPGDGLGQFTVGSEYTVGASSGRVVADDFDGDGKLDLATSNWMGGSISILFGNGTGAFAPAIFYPGNMSPAQMASADLNDDGAPDLVTGDGGSDYFTVHQNAGDGTFLPPVTFPSGGRDARSLVVGDFNGDGLPDVVTGNWSDGTLSLSLNTTPRPSPAIRSLTLNTNSIAGGGTFWIVGTVTLTAPAPAGGAVVTLVTDSPAIVVAPPSLTIPEGGTSAGFTLIPQPVTVARRGTLTARCNGTQQRVAVTVRPPRVWITLGRTNPVSVPGGKRAFVNIYSEAPAGPGGISLILSTDHPEAVHMMGTIVTIPPGQPGGMWAIDTYPVSVPLTVYVTASLPGGGTSMATLVILPGDQPLPLAAPTALVAAAVTLGQVNLSWTDNNTGETGFEIQRKGDSGDWTTIATAPAKGSSFADTTVDQGASYTYRVRALGSGGPSAWSNEAGVVAPAVPGLIFEVASYDFGPALVHSAGPAQSIPVTNSGHATLTLLNIVTFGGTSGDFIVNAAKAPLTIAPGDTGNIPVVFNPSGTGLRSAYLRVDDNAPGSPQVIKLTGTGVPPLAAYVTVDLGADLGTPIPYNADLFSGRLRLSINASGVVAGSIPLPNGSSHAAMNDAGGTHDLGTLPDYPNQSLAAGINAAGQIVGVSQIDAGSHGHAFLYAGGVMQELNTPGLPYVAAHGINDAGEVVGLAVGPGQSGAFLYDGAGVHNLGDLGGGSSDAFAINHTGQVAGWAMTADHHQHGFLYDSAGMHDLGALPGSQSSTAVAINDAGQIVGQSLFSATQYGHAFIYDVLGMHDMGTLGGFGSIAYGINNLEQVVGASEVSQGNGTIEHAFLYNVGAWTDLNSLLPPGSGWVLNEAHALNDAGQIVGLGTLNGQPHAFLLTFRTDARATVPPAPAGLAAKMVSTSELDLSWTDTSTNEQGFEIQRKVAGGDWSKVTVAAANATTFADTGMTAYTHYTYRVRAINGVGASDWSNEASGDTGTQGQVSLSGSGTLDFGSQAVGTPSAAQNITITNGGSGPLNIASVTVTGANASEFALAPTVATPVTLAPGESGSISLVFTPAGTGLRSATLTLTHDAPGGPSTVALTGRGIAPLLRLIPNALDFSQEPVGLNGSLAVLLQNTGDAPLTVSSIAVQGPNASEFALVPGGWSAGTLRPGEISLLNVRFLPAMTGSRTATLVIADNAPDSPQPVSLTGVGTAPLLSLSADSLVFGLPPGGTGSVTQTLTLTNTGDAPLTVDSVGLSGPDAGRFKILSDSGENNLAVGASRSLTITYTAATVASRTRQGRLARSAAARIAAVSYNATLEIHDNDPHPGAPHQVKLTALGASGSTPVATAPAAPTSLAAVVTPAPQVALTWTNNSSNETALAIWRQKDGGRFIRIGVVAPQTTHFTDAGMTPNTRYTYEVRAINNSGASPWSNQVTIMTPEVAPAGPTDLAATLTATNQVALTWMVHSQNETALAIWRQTGGSAWVRVGVVVPHTLHFTDTSVAPSNTYTYEVRAINNSGASPWSNRVSAATLEAAPAAPTNLTATVGVGEIDLTWTRGKGNETGISIFRRTGTGDWQRIGVVVPSATRYADRGVQPGKSYSYMVRAHNSHYASAWTNTVSGLTLPAP